LSYRPRRAADGAPSAAPARSARARRIFRYVSARASVAGLRLGHPRQPARAPIVGLLSGFLVGRVLAAFGAELLVLHPIRMQTLVLGGDVVPVFAVVARQGDLVTHVLSS